MKIGIAIFERIDDWALVTGIPLFSLPCSQFYLEVWSA
jgi:hypothetical protein